MRDRASCCEQSSLAAAVSNVVYRAPLGTIYSGVLQRFLADIEAENLGSIRKTLEETRWTDVPRGTLLQTTADGNGIGYVLFATAALRLFGLHAWAPPVLMLALMGLSAAAFLRRFSSELAVVVVLYFCSLTVMLFTPLIWHPGILSGTAPGGIRYFSLVAILPAFHILLDLTRSSAGSYHIASQKNLLLAIQVAIFALAILVRGSAVALIGAIAVVVGAFAWRNRRTFARLRPLLGKVGILVIVPIGLTSVILLSTPREYLTQGRFGTVVWHRVFVGLGRNPAWPFPGVEAMFDCKRYIPEGIGPGISDRNAHCVWWDYAVRHNISENDTPEGTHGGRYETSLREAFFKIARRYPGKVFATFFYYKPPLILESLRESIKTNMSVYPPFAVAMLIAAPVNLLVYFMSAAGVSIVNARRVAGLALLCAAFSIPQLLVGWALPNTAADLFFFLIFCVGLAFGAATIATRAALQPKPLDG
jgi:hypothetical protein